jgi:hypothetical protein
MRRRLSPSALRAGILAKVVSLDGQTKAAVSRGVLDAVGEADGEDDGRTRTGVGLEDGLEPPLPPPQAAKTTTPAQTIVSRQDHRANRCTR